MLLAPFEVGRATATEFTARRCTAQRNVFVRTKFYSLLCQAMPWKIAQNILKKEYHVNDEATNKEKQKVAENKHTHTQWTHNGSGANVLLCRLLLEIDGGGVGMHHGSMNGRATSTTETAANTDERYIFFNWVRARAKRLRWPWLLTVFQFLSFSFYYWNFCFCLWFHFRYTSFSTRKSNGKIFQCFNRCEKIDKTTSRTSYSTEERRWLLCRIFLTTDTMKFESE